MQLGLDPSSKPGEHHAALYDGEQCMAAMFRCGGTNEQYRYNP